MEESDPEERKFYKYYRSAKRMYPNDSAHIEQIRLLAEASGDWRDHRRQLKQHYPLGDKSGGGLLSAPLRAIAAINKAGRRNDYPPSMRSALEKYGNNKIVSLTVGRNPIVSAIQKVANVLVGDKLKALNIDTLFHLFLIIELDNGQKFKTERNQVLNFTSSIGEVKESMPVTVNKDITLSKFFESALNRVGKLLFTYSASSNNCQSYIIQLLGANGLLNDSIRNFVKQDTNTLLSPFLSKAADVVTDSAATFDRIVHGQGGGGKHVKLNF